MGYRLRQVDAESKFSSELNKWGTPDSEQVLVERYSSQCKHHAAYKWGLVHMIQYATLTGTQKTGKRTTAATRPMLMGIVL